MKKNSYWGVIIILLVVAYFLNPKFSKHLKKLGADSEYTSPLRRLGDPDYKPLRMVKYSYNNYLVYSTTTESFTGKRLTIGFFGFVFK